MLGGQFDQLHGVGFDVFAIPLASLAGAITAILSEAHRRTGPVFRADICKVINVKDDGMLCLWWEVGQLLCQRGWECYISQIAALFKYIFLDDCYTVGDYNARQAKYSKILRFHMHLEV